MTSFKCSGCGKNIETTGLAGLPHKTCPKGGRWQELEGVEPSQETKFQVVEGVEGSETDVSIPSRESVREEFAQIQQEFGGLHRRLIHAYKAADKLDRDDRPTQEDRTKAMQAARDFTDAVIRSKIAIPSEQ